MTPEMLAGVNQVHLQLVHLGTRNINMKTILVRAGKKLPFNANCVLISILKILVHGLHCLEKFKYKQKVVHVFFKNPTGLSRSHSVNSSSIEANVVTRLSK